ncbi:MAG TPA: prolipoprotein diacylglyceryl transferase [Terriglobales bacterium]|nr:prolipoprotein diacylglyceryl transferase [Terriglobales bacterium]
MHPHLLEFGRFAIPTYGVIAAAGLILGLLLNVRLAVRDGIDEDKTWNLGVIAIFSAIAGSKILFIITEEQYSLSDWRSLFSMSFLQSGGVYYGGLIGALLGAIWYMRRAQMPGLRTADAFAPGIAFGHGLGRLGCLAAGCCYGAQTDLPWAVIFTNPLAARGAGTPLDIPLHPTQVYEFMAEMVITSILLLMWRHRRFPGQIFGTYCFLYGVARFFLEFLRGDPGRGSVFGGLLTLTQVISIVFVIVGGVLWLRRDSPTLPDPAPANP